jgi:hypothetical protein
MQAGVDGRTGKSPHGLHCGIASDVLRRAGERVLCEKRAESL